MLLNNNKQYVTVAFDNEDELERVVLENSELLFGDLSFVLPKKKIATLDGAGTIPDGVIIDLRNKQWLILEAELAHHGTWNHIAPQVNKQLTATNNPATKEMLLNLSRDMISDDVDFLERLTNEIGLEPVRLQSHLHEIFTTQPEVAIPIDTVPNDLKEWASTLKAEVKIWELKKYIHVASSEILYSIPDDALPTSDSHTRAMPTLNNAHATRTPSELYQEMFNQNLLRDGEELYMSYRPRGGEQQTFSGVARINGIELDGQIYSPSTAALLCIQEVNPERPSVNGWLAWKNSEGKSISDLSLKLSAN